MAWRQRVALLNALARFAVSILDIYGLRSLVLERKKVRGYN